MDPMEPIMVTVQPDDALVVTWGSVEEQGTRDAAILQADSPLRAELGALLDRIYGGAR